MNILFSYLADSNKNSNKIIIEILPTGYSIIASTIPSHSLLIIETDNADTTFSIIGNEQQRQFPAIKLNEPVERLFAGKPDTTQYGAKVVWLVFYKDNIKMIDTYLTQLAAGYIKAQHRICIEKYHKKLSDATAAEIDELRKTNPLRFKIILKEKK
ncbi:MAG: hypothetical protein QM791_14075 [Ferruginibacter sp.]